jgi:hypothetical protein
MNNISIDEASHTIYCQIYSINRDTFTHLINEIINYENKIKNIHSSILSVIRQTNISRNMFTIDIKPTPINLVIMQNCSIDILYILEELRKMPHSYGLNIIYNNTNIFIP